MARALVLIASDAEREKAIRWIRKAPWNTRVTFQEPKRTLPQNDKFWAAMTDISRQLSWHGMKLAPEDWRLMFLAALGGEMRIVPNLTGNGFVDLGRSSSKLDKEEFSNLLEIVQAFCAEHGVKLTEPHAET